MFQSTFALHFARQAIDGTDQFEQLPQGSKYLLSSTVCFIFLSPDCFLPLSYLTRFIRDAQGVPLLSGCKAVFECSPFGSPSSPACHVVGSHTLWLAAVDRTHYNFERSPAPGASTKAQVIVQPPLIYYMKYKSCACLLQSHIVVMNYDENSSPVTSVIFSTSL